MFLLKSMFRMLFRFVSFFTSISPGLRILLKSSWEEDNDADEDSLDLLCYDSSLCFWCFKCSTYSSYYVYLSWFLRRVTCSWFVDLFYSSSICNKANSSIVFSTLCSYSLSMQFAARFSDSSASLIFSSSTTFRWKSSNLVLNSFLSRLINYSSFSKLWVWAFLFSYIKKHLLYGRLVPTAAVWVWLLFIGFPSQLPRSSNLTNLPYEPSTLIG